MLYESEEVKIDGMKWRFIADIDHINSVKIYVK